MAGAQARDAAALGLRCRRSSSCSASASPISAACRPSPGRCSSTRARASTTSPRSRASPMAARRRRRNWCKRLKEKFPKSPPGQGWGMTETSATAVSNTAEDYERKPDSCGVAVRHRRSSRSSATRVRRWRPARSASSGTAVRSSCAATGTSPKATAETFVDGWVQDRRPRAARRGGLPLHRRPRQGHADPRRREHLLRRGRERALRSSRGDGRRRDRQSRTRPSAKSRSRSCT